MTSPAGTLSLKASLDGADHEAGVGERLLGLGGGAREIGDLDLLDAHGS